LVEVPGGLEGPYTLVLSGAGSGAFTMKVAARYAGMTVYRQEIKGEIREGERLFTRLTHDVSGRDPRTARVLNASVEPLRAWDGPEPVAVVVPASPARRGAN